MDLVGILLQIVIVTIILAPVLWISGRFFAGKEKAKFTDALWIAFLGTVIGGLVGAFVGGLVAGAIILIVWLALIKHFFDCGWLKALLIAIAAVIIFAIIIAILAVIGIGIMVVWF
jgi:hypothetical protein